MKKIKMIGLDLDGTLLNSKKEVTDHTKRENGYGKPTHRGTP